MVMLCCFSVMVFDCGQLEEVMGLTSRGMRFPLLPFHALC